MSPGMPKWSYDVEGPGTLASVYERRSTIYNDNDLADGASPPASRTESEDRGKFYPRGCRGVIEQIQIYCKRTGSGTLDLSLSPHPGLGPIHTETLTPGSAWAWKSADIEEMWNYDSLFIWVSDCDADVSWAYDEVKPYDGHYSSDGEVWEDVDTRPFIRAVYTGETLGDVPVSGTLNIIPIPNVSSTFLYDTVVVEKTTWTTIIEVDGIGFVDLIVAAVETETTKSEQTYIRVKCDGLVAFSRQFDKLFARGRTDCTPLISLLEYEVDGVCTMQLNKHFSFRRKFEVRAYNPAEPVTVWVFAYPNLLK